ncbi:hypothetical protein VTK56DRAFT_8391 [Thermocarpiscus australiensis]
MPHRRMLSSHLRRGEGRRGELKQPTARTALQHPLFSGKHFRGYADAQKPDSGQNTLARCGSLCLGYWDIGTSCRFGKVTLCVEGISGSLWRAGRMRCDVRSGRATEHSIWR